MGQLFPKPLLISFAAIVLLTLGACDLLVSNESRIEKATQLRTQGDFRAAVIELKKVLHRSPDNRDARFLLGEISLLTGEAAAAEKELRRAQALGIPKDNVVIPLGRALLAQGDFDRASQELAANGIESAEVREGVLMLRGEAYLALGRLDQAEGAFSELLSLRADSLDARIGLALVAQGKGNLEAAETYIAEALSKDPTHMRGWLAKGRLELGRAQYTQAEEAFARVLKLPGLPAVEEFIARNGLAEGQWRQGKSDAALENVERWLELGMQHPRPNYFRALIAYGAGDYQTAKDHLQAVLRDFPDYQPAKLLLGATHYAQGDLEQADMYLSSVLAADPSSLSTRKLLAAIRLLQHKPQDAMAVLTPAMAEDSNDSQLLALMGKASLQAGHADTGILYLERGARTDPGNQALQMELAAGYVTAGELGRAIGLLDKMPETKEGDYGRELKLLLVRNYLETGDLDRARTLATELAKVEPENADVQNALGIVQVADRKYEEAVSSFRKAVAAAPDSPHFSYNLARARFSQQNFGEAKKLLAKTLELQPRHLQAVSTLAAIEMREGDAKQALARAHDLQQDKDKGTAAAGRVLEGDLNMMQGKFDGAARAYDAASKQDQTAVLAIKSYRARRQAQEPDPAKPLEQWLSKNPGDSRVRLALAQGYQERGQLKNAAAEYELVLKGRPSEAVALNNLAWVYHDTKDPRAIQIAERAHALQPENGAITDTLGWLLVLEGQAQRGLELLRMAAKQASGMPEIRYHLAVALAKTGANEEARGILTDLVNSGQNFKDMTEAKQLLQQL